MPIDATSFARAAASVERRPPIPDGARVPTSVPRPTQTTGTQWRPGNAAAARPTLESLEAATRVAADHAGLLARAESMAASLVSDGAPDGRRIDEIIARLRMREATRPDLAAGALERARKLDHPEADTVELAALASLPYRDRPHLAAAVTATKPLGQRTGSMKVRAELDRIELWRRAQETPRTDDVARTAAADVRRIVALPEDERTGGDMRRLVELDFLHPDTRPRELGEVAQSVNAWRLFDPLSHEARSLLTSTRRALMTTDMVADPTTTRAGLQERLDELLNAQPVELMLHRERDVVAAMRDLPEHLRPAALDHDVSFDAAGLRQLRAALSTSSEANIAATVRRLDAGAKLDAELLDALLATQPAARVRGGMTNDRLVDAALEALVKPTAALDLRMATRSALGRLQAVYAQLPAETSPRAQALRARIDSIIGTNLGVASNKYADHAQFGSIRALDGTLRALRAAEASAVPPTTTRLTWAPGG